MFYLSLVDAQLLNANYKIMVPALWLHSTIFAMRPLRVRTHRDNAFSGIELRAPAIAVA